MNEKLAWLADSTWELRWYVAIAIIAFGIGFTIHRCPATECPPCGGIVMGDLVQTFMKISPSETINMTQTPGMCDNNGTPIVRMFGTSWCPHCTAGKAVFEEFAAENEGRAEFRVLDVEQDTLTFQDFALFDQLSDGSVPTYVFGCSYFRVGNAFSDDPELEKQAFQDVLNALL
jgi:thiol-disulfide isomerase/thioredoxin